jgi:hypothetical protein
MMAMLQAHGDDLMLGDEGKSMFKATPLMLES